MARFNHDARMSAFAGPKDAVSVLNLLAGFASIVFAHEGMLLYAAGALLAAAIADALDGWVARTFFSPTEFGEAIDIADLVSFGAAPAFFLIVWLGRTTAVNIVALAVVTAALLRLARFQVREGHDEGWVGVPITVNGVLYPLLFVLDSPAVAVLAVAGIMAYLNVSALTVPKP
jgi:CDP-diacylglycerol--serine O-phosphatidyltransferase